MKPRLVLDRCDDRIDRHLARLVRQGRAAAQ